MAKVKVICGFCGKVYFREIGRFNEAKKFGWKQYCSRKCQNQARVTRVEKICANLNCHKKVFRELGQFKRSKSGRIFCSASCAAIVNNQIRSSKLKPKKLKICKAPGCVKRVPSGNKYCSRECAALVCKRGVADIKKEVLNKIKNFYNQKKRIPVKREMYGLYKRARKVFGTWNKAIEAAGFDPNPVLFAEKHIANDGHLCDSFAEKIIDDWLNARKIRHKRKIPYPENPSLTADFVTENNWIEFFGLAGEVKDYDRLVKQKRMLCKKYKLPLLETYPKDLFPVNRLSQIIKIKKT